MHSCPAKTPCYSNRLGPASFPPQCWDRACQPVHTGGWWAAEIWLGVYSCIHLPSFPAHIVWAPAPSRLMQGHRWHAVALSQRRGDQQPGWRPGSRHEFHAQPFLVCRPLWILLRLVWLDFNHSMCTPFQYPALFCVSLLDPPEWNHLGSHGGPMGASLLGDIHQNYHRKLTLTYWSSVSPSVKWEYPHTAVNNKERWHSGKESACQCRRQKKCRFNPRVGKILWRMKWQPTPVFLPGEFHGQKSMVGYSPWDCKESDTTEYACITHPHCNHHHKNPCPL